MEFLLIGVAAMGVIIIILFCHIISMRRSIDAIADEFSEWLSTDTNTLITVSSSDPTVRRLAARLNRELKILRRARLRYESGDAGLKAAVTDISHDLRTPLTAICGYLDLLEGEPKSEAAEKYLAVIRERTDSMRALTEEFFRYSIVNSAAEDLKIEPVCINDILEQSIAGFYGELTGRGIVPLISISEEKVIRELDAGALRRIFDNILSNAVRYSDGDLSILLDSDGRVEFSNRAKRLDRVDVERLFDRFRTVDNANGSTGLGLSIAKQLCGRLGGKISAEYKNGRLCIYLHFEA